MQLQNSGLLRRRRWCSTLPPAGVQVREVFAAPGTRSEAANPTGRSCRRSGFVALATSGRMRRQEEHNARPLPAAHTPRRRTLSASSHARLIRACRAGGVDRRRKARHRGFRRRRRQTHCNANIGGRERRSGLHIPRRRRWRCVSRSIWSAPRSTQSLLRRPFRVGCPLFRGNPLLGWSEWRCGSGLRGRGLRCGAGQACALASSAACFSSPTTSSMPRPIDATSSRLSGQATMPKANVFP
jgi:hypothetical protein